MRLLRLIFGRSQDYGIKHSLHLGSERLLVAMQDLQRNCAGTGESGDVWEIRSEDLSEES